MTKNTQTSLNKASTFGTTWTPLFTVVALLILVGFGELIKQPLIIPPLAATAAYIFGAPGIPGTQPRSVLGGNLLSAALAFGALALFGSHFWVAAVTAGLVFAAMNAVKLFHIPSVATAVLVVMLQPKNAGLFMVNLAVGSIVLSLVGLIISKITKKIEYPLYW